MINFIIRIKILEYMSREEESLDLDTNTYSNNTVMTGTCFKSLDTRDDHKS